MLKETNTGQTISTNSDEKGAYKFTQVPKSIYEMEIQAPDFESLMVKDIAVNKNLQLENAFTKTDIKIEIDSVNQSKISAVIPSK